MRLVLVVGPPRSGTSLTARLLHERVGICMGHNLVPGNMGNPKGFYEDFEMVQATLTKDPKIWKKMLELNHADCDKTFGVKTPELAFIDMSALEPDLIIRTCRSPIAIADSLEKWRQPKPSMAEALKLAVSYEKAIEEQIIKIKCPVHRVDLYKKRDEDELEHELKEVCSSVVQGRIHGS